MALYLRTEEVSLSGAPTGTRTFDVQLPSRPASEPQVALQAFDLSYQDNEEKKLHSILVSCSVIGWSETDLTIQVVAGMRDDGAGNVVTSKVRLLIIADMI